MPNESKKGKDGFPKESTSYRTLLKNTTIFNCPEEQLPRTRDEMKEYDDKIFMSETQRAKIRETQRKREYSHRSLLNQLKQPNVFYDKLVNDPDREISRSLDFKMTFPNNLRINPILSAVEGRGNRTRTHSNDSLPNRNRPIGRPGYLPISRRLPMISQVRSNTSSTISNKTIEESAVRHIRNKDGSSSRATKIRGRGVDYPLDAHGKSLSVSFGKFIVKKISLSEINFKGCVIYSLKIEVI